MPLALALEVMEQAARALAAAEACGVVHRDIKPSNIMLEFDAAGALLVKVIDYGVAKVLASEADASPSKPKRLHWHPCLCQPGTIRQHWTNTHRHTLRYLLPWRYLLVFALWRFLFVGRTLEDIHARQPELIPVEQLKGLDIPNGCLALLKSMLAPDPKIARSLRANYGLRSTLLRKIQRRITGRGVEPHSGSRTE